MATYAYLTNSGDMEFSSSFPNAFVGNPATLQNLRSLDFLPVLKSFADDDII